MRTTSHSGYKDLSVSETLSNLASTSGLWPITYRQIELLPRHEAEAHLDAWWLMRDKIGTYVATEKYIGLSRSVVNELYRLRVTKRTAKLISKALSNI